MTLSGGMNGGDDRQGLSARAHILFLDEPTAGVHVELLPG